MQLFFGWPVLQDYISRDKRLVEADHGKAIRQAMESFSPGRSGILGSWRYYDQTLDSNCDTPRVQRPARLRPKKGKRESGQRRQGDERHSPDPGQHPLGSAAEGRVRDRAALGPN